MKCVTKSPTDAELVVLTDNLGLVELSQEFVEFIMMKKLQVPIIYQDCNVVVSLVTKGGGITRTKHVRVRRNLTKEMVDEKRNEVVYTKVEEMIADGFSKPFDPVKHTPFAKLIQGHG